MISFKKQMHTEITNTASHSQYELNKYSGLPWKQHRLSKSSILFRETPGSVVVPQSTENAWW